MDIKTKFSNGDIVFFMKDNKITKGAINRINVSVRIFGNLQCEYYDVDAEISNFSMDLLFKTKEELLKSL